MITKMFFTAKLNYWQSMIRIIYWNNSDTYIYRLFMNILNYCKFLYIFFEFKYLWVYSVNAILKFSSYSWKFIIIINFIREIIYKTKVLKHSLVLIINNINKFCLFSYTIFFFKNNYTGDVPYMRRHEFSQEEKDGRRK